MIELTTWEEFSELENRGFFPLNNPAYYIDIKLRIEIQNKLFGKSALGKGKTNKSNQKFYQYCWMIKPHRCEETFAALNYYSSAHISHILSRGAHPEMALDIRNINILSYEAHQQWEFGDRKSMRIYLKNLEIIDKLKEEYSKV